MNLPSYYDITKSEQNKVIDVLVKLLVQCKNTEINL